jgi:spore maturation protein SpmB
MFLVLNTSGLTLIPVTIMNYRHTFGASNPSDVFLPILISTFCASLFGLIVTSIYQKINLFNKTILLYLGGMSLIVFGMLAYFSQLDTEQLKTQSSLLSNIILYGLICGFIVMAMMKKVNVYDSFIEGAKGGFQIAVKIIPFLVAILVSIAVFKASGAMDYLSFGMQWVFGLFLEDTTFVDAIPTALMRPLSGSGARGMMLSSWSEFGVDSFVGRLTATMQGATDTTFYIVAVYFGSVAIKNTRYAIKVGLLADLGGVIASIIVCSMFFKTEEVHLSKKQMASEIVNVWNEKNSNIKDEKLNFISDDVVFIDQSYDTITNGKQEFINFDSFNNDSIILNKIIEVEEVIFIKTENGKNSFKITFDKGKVIEVMYQGNYPN